MYYYSLLLLLTRCEEEKIFYKGGWRIKSQSTLCRPASQWVRGCRTDFNILNAWSCQTFFLYSNFLFVCVWKDLFFFFFDRKISATTPNVWRLLLWNIQKRVFRFVFIYFFVGSVIFSSSSSSCCYPRPWSLLSISSNVWRVPVKPLWLESRVQQLIGTFAQVPNREVAGVGVSLNR